MSNSIRQSKELEGLAKLLFDRSVLLRYSALGIEVAAGLLAAVVSFVHPQVTVTYFFAVIGFVMLAIAYALKIFFSKTYDVAETMRRQAVFVNGLGWDIDGILFSEWRRIAGDTLVTKNNTSPLEDDYYATKEDVGDLKLLEMIQESAFWTRHLYKSIAFYMWIIVIFALSLVVAVFVFTSSVVVSPDSSQNIVYVLFLLMPILLTVDVLNWALKLGSVGSAIQSIEENLERLKERNDYETQDLLRLVSEYNCQLVQGFPIPNWFFSMKHNHIQKLWNHHVGEKD